MLTLPGAVSPDMLHNASFRTTLTITEVVDTENGVTILPFLLDTSSVVKMQLWFHVTDSRYYDEDYY